MTPLGALAPASARHIRGLVFDLDDTLLSHGILRPDTFAALSELAKRGFLLACATGRPAGWGEVLLPQWPVRGFLTENGAILFLRTGSLVRAEDPIDPEERRARRRRLDELKALVAHAFPDIPLANDTHGRISDVAWDIGETKPAPKDRIDALLGFLRSHGARTLTSSIHAHATFDRVDKASGAVRMLSALGFRDPTRTLHEFAYVGDSANDASCFAAFRLTVGVQNVVPHLPALSVPPRYVTHKPMGEGFVELAEWLLSIPK